MGLRTGSERALVIGMIALGVVGIGVLTPLMAGHTAWGWIIAIDGLFAAVVWLQTTRGIHQLRNREKEKRSATSRTPSPTPHPPV